MLMNLLLVLVALLVLLAAFVATRPADFRIVRTRTVAAAPQVVHGFINDFHKWPAWSPWEKIDPDMKREHSGPPSGTGAQYHWVGNKKVGEGRMTIVDTRPPTRRHHPPRVPQALQGHEHHAVRPVAERWRHSGVVGDDRPQRLHGEGVLAVHEHGKGRGPGFRKGPGRPRCSHLRRSSGLRALK